jgi:hypothetical protein
VLGEDVGGGGEVGRESAEDDRQNPSHHETPQSGRGALRPPRYNVLSARLSWGHRSDGARSCQYFLTILTTPRCNTS